MNLNNLVILLSDTKRCLQFYEELLPLLRFEKIRDHVFANEQLIHLDFRPATDPKRGYQRHVPGLGQLTFVADNLEQILEIGFTMKQAGHDVPGIRAFEDRSALFLRDADGMRVEVAVDH